mmetsp:Transcript_21981/g.10344  ORF Transcript_21981/g.10344 Transcript_21981/m.10344 type:complete len:113 (-) Transcript_21981:59-397(-)
MDFERVGRAITLYSTNTIYYIGNDNGFDSPWGIALDEIRIWETALTATELLNYYNLGVELDATSLVMYYKCNEGIGDVVYNKVLVPADDTYAYSDEDKSINWKLDCDWALAG